MRMLIRRFNDYNRVIEKEWESRISERKEVGEYINEEINLGNTSPFPIDHALYKSGDYICSSFTIGNRQVIVSSIEIPSSEIVNISGNRHINDLGSYVKQFNYDTDSFIFVEFGEYSNSEYNDQDNVNDNSTLFRKMTTIIEVIKTFNEYYSNRFVVFNSVDNDKNSGIESNHNKRDTFYKLFMAYNDVEYKHITGSFSIQDELINSFYVLKI